MGITKQYLRYVPAGNFNIIASSNCNVVFVVIDNEGGRFLAAGASEDIVVWDLRLSEKRLVIPGEKHEVTQLAASPNKVLLAAGYSDGSVRTYDLNSTDNLSVFSGHRSAVTCFAFDHHGHRLASGAKDTEIVVWDLVAERGIVRLSGHKGVVTQVQFLGDKDILVSASKDTFIKLWDIATGHCFKTIDGHIHEVWGLCLVRENDFIVSGSADNQLRVWQVSEAKGGDDQSEKENQILVGEDDCTSRLSPVVCTKSGSILRTGKDRVVSLRTDPDCTILAVHGTKNTVELFQFLTKEEANHKHKKRRQRERKKAAKLGKEVTEGEDKQVNLEDTVRRLPLIKCSAKPKSVHLVVGKGSQLRVAVSLNNNTIELYTLDVSNTNNVAHAEVTFLRSISTHGHHSEVRSVAFSSDNLAIVSGSGDQVKMWNRPSLACLHTVDTSYVLSVMFVPGDRHVLAGCKDGQLLIIDIAVGDILENIPAHTSELWSICHLPDQTGVVTGGGDNTVKFWQLELVPDTVTNTRAKVLSLLHTRTLQVDEPVLCVRVSANSKLIAVALLDSTVKIFFMDTLKFFLSLYGHKLPVLCMDISSDCTMIATGSADRNIKIWGLDFGDCHKSIFAHDDSVTGLAFVPDTHYFFTTGKDGKVKEWDADNFQKIITLEGHHGEAWGLAVSSNGQYVVSCGQDRVLRMYERTTEPLVLDDEREAELEAEEENLATGPDRVTATNLNLASRKTVTAEKAAELLLECLEVGGEYRMAVADSERAGQPPPTVPAIMAAFKAKSADDYLMEVIKRIKASDLEDTLLLLPYTSVCELLPLLIPLLQQLHCDIICRLVVFLLKAYHRPLSASPQLQPLIAELSRLALARTSELRDLIGTNYHGMLFLQREMEAREGVHLFKDATVERKERERKKRRREKITQRAVLTL
ncbi:Dip2/Utp12 protein [Homalodisca vitripennis]|nr:Dip2/Utp12 protein [Homalodisca vitripennis]